LPDDRSANGEVDANTQILRREFPLGPHATKSQVASGRRSLLRFTGSSSPVDQDGVLTGRLNQTSHKKSIAIAGIDRRAVRTAHHSAVAWLALWTRFKQAHRRGDFSAGEFARIDAENHPLSNRNRVVVAWGVVAAIRPPGADTELFVFLPAIEGCQAEVQDDNTLSTADVVEQRRFSAFAPPELGLVGIVVAEDDHVVRGEHFGPCPSELLGDANLDAAGVFKDLAKGGSSATPVMARRVLASDDEGLELRSVNVFRAAEAAERPAAGREPEGLHPATSPRISLFRYRHLRGTGIHTVFMPVW
jgi:hypothetical protein